jgi:uncharacterized protein
MDRVRLGRTNLMVSRIGFGGIPIQRRTEADAIAVVRRCLDHDINFIDTANGYTTSEERIGKAIAGRKRKDLIIATKSGARDKEGIAKHLEKSLKMLGTDYIDLYQFHGVNDVKNLEMVLDPKGLMEVVQKALKDGVIKHLGITCHAMDAAKAAVKTDKFETMMFPFNFVTSEAVDDLLPLCRKHDVGFISMKPLAGGMLDNTAVAFKYLLQFPDIFSLVGIEKIEEIDEIVGLLGKSLKMTVTENRELARMKKELGKTFCRRCDYCQPCRVNINISTVMGYHSFIKRLPPERVFNSWLTPLMEKVYDCTDCGDCEGRCPFKLPIRDLIKEYGAQFKTSREAWQKQQV